LVEEHDNRIENRDCLTGVTTLPCTGPEPYPR